MSKASILRLASFHSLSLTYLSSQEGAGAYPSCQQLRTDWQSVTNISTQNTSHLCDKLGLTSCVWAVGGRENLCIHTEKMQTSHKKAPAPLRLQTSNLPVLRQSTNHSTTVVLACHKHLVYDTWSISISICCSVFCRSCKGCLSKLFYWEQIPHVSGNEFDVSLETLVNQKSFRARRSQQWAERHSNTPWRWDTVLQRRMIQGFHFVWPLLQNTDSSPILK